MNGMAVNDGLQRTSPESQGVPSAAVNRLLDSFAEKELELHSIMILRRGKVVAEGWWQPYRADDTHMLFSLSKSFTSTAIGFAVEEGLISLDDLVCDFFADKLPDQVGPNLAQMRIRHLLTMSAGHDQDPTVNVFSTPDGDWVKAFLAQEVAHEPGTHFVYNTAATYMLSAIIRQVTGQNLIDYLTPRLFEPLGIVGATWENCPQGTNVGGSGLSVKTSDIAKFGQLYLQQGVWNGKQLISREWVREATSKQMEIPGEPASDWTQGYGYQFWRCRHNSYRGDGAFGQFCVVVPEQQLVVAITAGVMNMQAVLDSLWDVLLPALSPAPLPADQAEQERLQARLQELALPLLPAGKRVHGQSFAGRYVFPENDQALQWADFVFAPDGCTVTLEFAADTAKLPAGYGRYGQGSFPLPRFGNALAYSCASWHDEHSLEVLARLVETPFAYTLNCKFSPGEVELKASVNCSFGPREYPPIKGRLESR